MSSETQRVAVLIDFENTSHRMADRVFEEAAKLGDVVLSRGYADFSNERMATWEDAVHAHLIAPMHQFAIRKGKNSTDIAMAVDAMNLVHNGHQGRIDIFCVVSSDSDFTALAKGIRECGHVVVGMGRTPPPMLVQACDEFIDVSAAKKTKPALSSPPANEDAESESSGRWVTLSEIGVALRKQYPAFRSKDYGFKTLTDLIGSVPDFEMKKDAVASYARLSKRLPSQIAVAAEVRAAADEGNVIRLSLPRGSAGVAA